VSPTSPTPRVAGPELPGAGRVVATIVAALAAAAFPVFLTGALQGRIADDLGMGSGAIGASIAAFFVAGAVASVPGGRLVDRIGSVLALRLGMVVAVVASTGIAAFADRPWRLTVGLAVAGSALSLVDPGGARGLVRAVPPSRQGLAFGAKEASIPLASFLAGLVLPVLGAQLGWRPAFVGGAALAVITGLTVPRHLDARRPPATIGDEPGGQRTEGTAGPARPPRTTEPAADLGRRGDAGAEVVDAEHGLVREPVEMGRGDAHAPGVAADATSSPSTDPGGGQPSEDRGSGPLLFGLAVAAALAGGAAAAVASFLVPTAELAGLGAGAAGALLAAASTASIAMRLLSGASVDRRPGSELAAIAVLAGLGTVGVAGLAWASGPGAGAAGGGLTAGAPAVVATVGLVLTAVVSLGAGWGWTGLVFLAAVRLEPERPARAAGAVLAGLGVGGAAGPAVLGWMAEVQGFAAAWVAGAISMAVATLLAVRLRVLVRARHADGVA
jgi:hypothetical protein